MELNTRHRRNQCSDANKTEMGQLDEYGAFKELGKESLAPVVYKKILSNLVYDVKNDGYHKASLVADGHLTYIPFESVYSGVVSLRGIRILVFID